MTLRNRIRQRLQQRRQRREIDALRKRSDSTRRDYEFQIGHLTKLRDQADVVRAGLKKALENCRDEDRAEIERYAADTDVQVKRIEAEIKRMTESLEAMSHDQ